MMKIWIWCQKVDITNSTFTFLCLSKNIYQKHIFSQKKIMAVTLGEKSYLVVMDNLKWAIYVVHR